LYRYSEVPMTLTPDGAGGFVDASAQLSSESTHHEWHRLPKTRPGWGFLEPSGGAYINEPQSGGSRVSVHITGAHAATMPRCVAIGSCFTATAADPSAGGGGETAAAAVAGPAGAGAGQQAHRRRLLKKKRKAEADPIIVAATVDTVESLPAMYGEVEAACSAEHFPKSLQLAVYDAAAEEWTEVLRFRGSEMREVTGISGFSLRTVLVPEVGGRAGRFSFVCLDPNHFAFINQQLQPIHYSRAATLRRSASWRRRRRRARSNRRSPRTTLTVGAYHLLTIVQFLQTSSQLLFSSLYY
jgi:hypothetical protein